MAEKKTLEPFPHLPVSELCIVPTLCALMSMKMKTCKPYVHFLKITWVKLAHLVCKSTHCIYRNLRTLKQAEKKNKSISVGPPPTHSWFPLSLGILCIYANDPDRQAKGGVMCIFSMSKERAFSSVTLKMNLNRVSTGFLHDGWIKYLLFWWPLTYRIVVLFLEETLLGQRAPWLR